MFPEGASSFLIEKIPFAEGVRCAVSKQEVTKYFLWRKWRKHPEAYSAPLKCIVLIMTVTVQESKVTG